MTKQREATVKKYLNGELHFETLNKGSERKTLKPSENLETN
jgi:hypothetical protein